MILEYCKIPLLSCEDSELSHSNPTFCTWLPRARLAKATYHVAEAKIDLRLPFSIMIRLL